MTSTRSAASTTGTGRLVMEWRMKLRCLLVVFLICGGCAREDQSAPAVSSADFPAELVAFVAAVPSIRVVFEDPDQISMVIGTDTSSTVDGSPLTRPVPGKPNEYDFVEGVRSRERSRPFVVVGCFSPSDSTRVAEAALSDTAAIGLTGAVWRKDADTWTRLR